MENIDFLNNYNAAGDNPDARDYTHEEVFGEMASSVELPKKIILEKAYQLMQGSVGACTIVGGLNTSNETNKQAVENFEIFTNWQKIWEIAKTKGASDTKGWWLQSAQQLLKDEGITGGYVTIGSNGNPNIGKMKQILAIEKKAIYTGVPIANWSETSRNHEYSLNKPAISGHAFDITGYDDDHKCKDGTTGAFFVGNSWQDGYFWLPYSMVTHLFTQYVNIYTDDIEKMKEAKKKRKNIFLQKAFEKKIWNEERPADAVTGAEVRIMMNRALGLADDYQWTRKALQMLATDKISRGKVLIAQTGRDWEIASDYELNLIVQRHITRNPSLNAEVITREQMAEVVWRDFL